MDKIITDVKDKIENDLPELVESEDEAQLPAEEEESNQTEDNSTELQTPAALSRIGPYDILELIGEGGMGLVYKVRHRGAGNILALKILRKELANDPINVKRFQQELKTTSMLTHPNMVPIYDSGLTADGEPFLVMEYIDGWNLNQILEQEGYLDLERFFQLFTQVCDALTHAHERRIIHRDLKPSNIMIS
ncbi:MAG: serine/threonine protein kinase, partial [Cyanobacteria bacterium]|nr:serine/threonine protein kinase [Cyanobacteriota bacterium]